MASGAHTFTHGLDYGSIVAASESVAWTVDEVFTARRFDATKPIVPTSWVGTDALALLTDGERLALNHCRAFSYVHLLGNFEEFVPRHLSGIVERNWHGDRAHLRALLRFGDEEMKHQELFLHAEAVLEESCGHSFGRYFDEDKVRVTALSEAILEHPTLSRFLVILALELGTQRHYVESVRHRDEPRVDPLYVDLLKAHWVEEAQHVKSDALEIGSLAAGMSPKELGDVFDHVGAVARLVDAAFLGQAEQEIETLQRLTGRVFPDAQRTMLRETLHASMRAILADVGLTHPSFRRVAVALSSEGAARLGIA
jgi:hypothetical protein